MLASCEKPLPHQQKVSLDKPAELSLSIDGVEEVIGLMAPKTKTYNIHVTAGSVADEFVTVTIAPNPDQVAAFNAANNTDYEMVPGDAYEISKKTFYIPRYNTEGTSSSVTIKADGLPDDEKVRVLPITITKVESEDDVTVVDSTVFIRVYRISTANIRFEKGTGTAADPFLVEHANDMYAMANDLKEGEATYIKLVNDIDMSSIEEWMPVNIGEQPKTIHFDGDGKTISNMKCVSETMPSLFGYLIGSCKNVNFKDCEIKSFNGNTGAGLIAAQAENAEFSNITATGIVFNSQATAHGSGRHIGGIAGITSNCKFENINIELDVIDGNGDGNVTRIIGGLVGMTLPKISTATSFMGQAGTDKTVNPTTFNNCHTSGSIFGHHYVGGFVGVLGVENSVVTNCSADVDVKARGNYCGGFIGYINKGATVADCHSTGNLESVEGNYKGGFIGVCQGNVTIQRCYSTGNVTNTAGTHIGGFIGNLGSGTGDFNDKTAYGDSLVEDCYCTGNLTVTNGNGNSGRMNAGFIAILEKIKNCTVRRCYSSGDLSAMGANGPTSGFIGMFKMASVPEDMNGTVEHCIAWNKKVETKTTNADTWSSGAIVGVSSNTNTMTDCYRRADMEYSETCGSDVYTLSDHENSSPSAPLPYDASFHKGYKCPYHGKAAPAGATCSQVAQSLGWPTEVWDLTGDMPKLK